VARSDNLDELVERIAEAVVAKLEERRKIDLIADAVLARLEEREQADEESAPAGKRRKESARSKQSPRGRSKVEG